MYASIPSIQWACVLNTCNSLCCTTLNNIKYLLDKVLLTLWSFASILNHYLTEFFTSLTDSSTNSCLKHNAVLLLLGSLIETLLLAKITVNHVSNENDYGVIMK